MNGMYQHIAKIVILGERVKRPEDRKTGSQKDRKSERPRDGKTESREDRENLEFRI